METITNSRAPIVGTPYPLPPGTRWKALPASAGVGVTQDVVEDRPGGEHIASVVGYTTHGEACGRTLAHLAAVAAAPVMLTVLTELLIARERGHDPGWGRVLHAVLLGAGAPWNGAGFTSRFDEVQDGERRGRIVTPVGSRWTVLRSDFSDAHGVTVLLVADRGEGWARLSLTDLRARFRSADG